MFNMGFSEIIIIGVLALLLIGPKQLPEMARVLGRLIAEFKKATADLSGGLLDIKSELQRPVQESLDELQKMKADILAKVEAETRRVQEMTDMDEKTVNIHHEDLHQDDLHHEDDHVAAQDKDERK